MEDIFICPKCGTSYLRNEHYLYILNSQNFINQIMGNKLIIDMCSKCNYFVEDK
jgi:predicted nucleic-acid-binding Zn-ribbon protein